MNTALNEAIYSNRPALMQPDHADRSAVSWGAIFAGAIAAASLSLILLVLGVGLGLSSISPWSAVGISAGAFGVSTIIWLTLTQIAASGMGGYLAGRLRSRWSATHTDEVYFRDTAHGFLAWAVATLLTATLLSSVTGSILGGGARMATASTGAALSSVLPAGLGAVSGMAASGSRPANTATTNNGPSDTSRATPSWADVEGMVSPGLRAGQPLSSENASYLAEQLAQRSGISQEEAEKRVNEAYRQLQTRMKAAEDSAKEAAEKARRATAWAALWIFISLLIGAFIASLAATFGGRRRDLPAVHTAA